MLGSSGHSSEDHAWREVNAVNQVIDCNFDAHEIVLTVQNGKTRQEQHVAYDKIRSVQMKEITAKGWFGSKQVPAIELTVKQSEDPFLLRKDVMKNSFDHALSAMERFAERYQWELKK